MPMHRIIGGVDEKHWALSKPCIGHEWSAKSAGRTPEAFMVPGAEFLIGVGHHVAHDQSLLRKQALIIDVDRHGSTWAAAFRGGGFGRSGVGFG